MHRLLIERFPGLATRHSVVELADGLPTPVEPMRGLGAAWGIPRLYVKREDRISTDYGGNKVRKLEWLLGAARAAGRRSVLTSGARGSHHALATALYAQRLGMRATLILAPQQRTEHVEAVFRAIRATGARILSAPAPVAHLLAYAVRALGRAARGAVWPGGIAPGGSEALGILGSAEAGLELARQVEDGALPPPDYVYVAVGSGGTVAGLSLGLALGAVELPLLRTTRVVGVQVLSPLVTGGWRVRGLQRGALRLLRRSGAELPAELSLDNLVLVDEELGAGYGCPTPQAEAACSDALEHENLELETTYTGKALAGLRRFALAQGDRREATHIYLHTLGRLRQ